MPIFRQKSNSQKKLTAKKTVQVLQRSWQMVGSGSWRDPLNLLIWQAWQFHILRRRKNLVPILVNFVQMLFGHKNSVFFWLLRFTLWLLNSWTVSQELDLNETKCQVYPGMENTIYTSLHTCENLSLGPIWTKFLLASPIFGSCLVKLWRKNVIFERPKIILTMFSVECR